MNDILNGRTLLAFLQSLSSEELNLPVVASIPVDDNIAEQHQYLAVDVSKSPNNMIAPRVPGARVPRSLVEEAAKRAADDAKNSWVGGSDGDFVNEVDPNDLRRTWTMMRNIHEKHSASTWFRHSSCVLAFQ